MHIITESDLKTAQEQASKVCLASCSLRGVDYQVKVIYFDFLLKAFTVVTGNGVITTDNLKEACTAYNRG